MPQEKLTITSIKKATCAQGKRFAYYWDTELKGAAGSFIVRTPKLEDKETYSISSMLPKKKDIPIQDVLSVISEQTASNKDFIHDTPSMQNHNPERNDLFATLIAYGCNVGIPRMAQITKGQSNSVLKDVARQYMHIDKIKRANDNIVKKIDEISSYFNNSDLLHTSSDGQKYNIKGYSLNANASYKYHGTGQSVSSYNFTGWPFCAFLCNGNIICRTGSILHAGWCNASPIQH